MKNLFNKVVLSDAFLIYMATAIAFIGSFVLLLCGVRVEYSIYALIMQTLIYTGVLFSMRGGEA